MRVPNVCFTKLRADREWHRESWVGRGERGRVGWPATTACGLELGREDSRVRKRDLPPDALRCAGCFSS